MAFQHSIALSGYNTNNKILIQLQDARTLNMVLRAAAPAAPWRHCSAMTNKGIVRTNRIEKDSNRIFS